MTIVPSPMIPPPIQIQTTSGQQHIGIGPLESVLGALAELFFLMPVEGDDAPDDDQAENRQSDLQVTHVCVSPVAGSSRPFASTRLPRAI